MKRHVAIIGGEKWKVQLKKTIEGRIWIEENLVLKKQMEQYERIEKTLAAVDNRLWNAIQEYVTGEEKSIRGT